MTTEIEVAIIERPVGKRGTRKERGTIVEISKGTKNKGVRR